MSKPNNIEELRDNLLDAFEWVKADPRRANQVKEMVNAAGKVIGTLKLELEYSLLRRQVPYIEFLGGDASPEEIRWRKMQERIPPPAVEQPKPESEPQPSDGSE